MGGAPGGKGGAANPIGSTGGLSGASGATASGGTSGSSGSGGGGGPSGACQGSGPPKSPCATSQLDVAEYMVPDCSCGSPHNLQSSGSHYQARTFAVGGEKGFYLIKSADGVGFEEWRFDDQFMRIRPGCYLGLSIRKRVVRRAM